MRKAIIITMLFLLLASISCSNMSGGEKGALAGAGIGAAGGAAITAIVGGNAAVGAAVGQFADPVEQLRATLVVKIFRRDHLRRAFQSRDDFGKFLRLSSTLAPQDRQTLALRRQPGTAADRRDDQRPVRQR